MTNINDSNYTLGTLFVPRRYAGFVQLFGRTLPDDTYGGRLVQTSRIRTGTPATFLLLKAPERSGKETLLYGLLSDTSGNLALGWSNACCWEAV